MLKYLMDITKDDKWIAVSCIQKAIRRGHSDLAQKYVEALWKVEPSYLLYRLSIIAVEDIGLANPTLIQPFIESEIKKDNIKQLGGLDYLLGLTEKMSLSNKDRSACDLGHLASYCQPEKCDDEQSYQKKYLSLYQNNQLKSLEDLIQTSLVMWQLCGTKKFKHASFTTEANFEKILEVFNPSPTVLSIVTHANNFQREPIAYNLILLEKILEIEKNMPSNGKWQTGDIVEKIFTPVVINEWLMAGVDKHTSIGNKALERLLGRNKKLQEALKPLPKSQWLDYLGYIQFRSDCEHVNKRLFYPTAIKIYQGCREYNAEIYKQVSEAYLSQRDELKKILEDMLKYKNYRSPKI